MAVIGTVYGDETVVARIQAMPERLRQSLVDAMKKKWFDLQRLIVTSKLSGQVLRRRTGNLASSINVGGPMSATDFFDSDPREIIGRVGTKVWYGEVHEYGGTFTIGAHDRQVSQVFGREVTPFTQHVSQYTATFPERSFLRSGLRDMSTDFRDAIATSIRESLG